jgi:hypothetical protein
MWAESFAASSVWVSRCILRITLNIPCELSVVVGGTFRDIVGGFGYRVCRVYHVRRLLFPWRLSVCPGAIEVERRRTRNLDNFYELLTLSVNNSGLWNIWTSWFNISCLLFQYINLVFS